MQKNLQYNGNPIALDPKTDVCLFAAPRATKSADPIRVRGRDLFVHEELGIPPVYYFVRWETRPKPTQTIQVTTPRQAERFLGAAGLECHTCKDSYAYFTLRNYGYGIVEEF